MWPVASFVPRLTIRIATRGTRKNAPSQAIPGSTKNAPPRRAPRRRLPVRRMSVAAPAATVRSPSGTSATGLRPERVPALGVLVEVGAFELDELGQLAVHRGGRVEVRVGQERGVDGRHRGRVRTEVARVVRVGRADPRVEVEVDPQV